MSVKIENPIYSDALVKAIQDSVVPVTVQVGDETFSTSSLKRTPDKDWEPMQLKSLTGFVDYVKLIQSGREPNVNLDSIFVHVRDYNLVHLVTCLGSVRNRRIVAAASYSCPSALDGLATGTTIEQAIINLKTCFVNPNISDPQSYANGIADVYDLLRFLGNVEHKTIETNADDGISQATSVRSGFGRVENQVLPSPCNLQAFRTFLEIEQPLCPWIVRLYKPGDEIKVKLIEADGGMWKTAAVDRIKSYLESELQGTNIPILA